MSERDPRVRLTWKPTPRQMVDIEQQFRLGRSDEYIAEIYSVDPADIANIRRATPVVRAGLSNECLTIEQAIRAEFGSAEKETKRG